MVKRKIFASDDYVVGVITNNKKISKEIPYFKFKEDELLPLDQLDWSESQSVLIRPDLLKRILNNCKKKTSMVQIIVKKDMPIKVIIKEKEKSEFIIAPCVDIDGRFS